MIKGFMVTIRNSFWLAFSKSFFKMENIIFWWSKTHVWYASNFLRLCLWLVNIRSIAEAIEHLKQVGFQINSSNLFISQKSFNALFSGIILKSLMKLYFRRCYQKIHEHDQNEIENPSCLKMEVFKNSSK